MRLDKFLSDCRVSGRNETKEMVKQGRITIDGVKASKSSDKVNAGSIVMADGRIIEYRKYIYLMMNKPAGYISAAYDKKHPAVAELLEAEYRKFDPAIAGRLDIDTEGLLLLSNDGDFVHRVISPKKNVYKRYFAVLDREAEDKDREIFASGMDLGDFTARPAEMEICENRREVFVQICEGKFHQVKRMFEKVGKRVTYLKRVSIGGLELDAQLASGAARPLSDEEIDSIFRQAI